MFKLIGLELKKNNYIKYFAGAMLITTLLLGLTYLFAFVPHLKAGSSLERSIMEALTPLFSQYNNISILICVLSMVCFSIYSGLIFAEFVLSDYIGKKIYLLLVYPIQKGTLYFAKVAAAIIIILVSALISNTVVFSVFYLIELKYPLVVGDILTSSIVFTTFRTMFLFIILSMAIGLISLRIGFVKKSTHITLITSFILSIVISNLMGMSLLTGSSAANNVLIALATAAFVIASGLVISYAGTVAGMEGE